ncbi:hypothetical protein pdam_00003115, partial [Pocillopora damicornis]
MNAYQENTIVPLSTNVSILWVHISAHIVDLDILTMERPVKISMSVTMVAITVMMRPIVQTPLDHSIAAANLDTLEMDGTFAQ